jgi:predicted lipid-binding transport protein (Tim44 family)
MIECNQQLMQWTTTGDGGMFDMTACERACAARKSAARTPPSPPPAARAIASPSADAALSRSLLPVGLLMCLVITGAGVGYGLRRRKDREWAKLAGNGERQGTIEEQRRYASVEAALADLGGEDADAEGFSRVLFEDFLYALYAEVHAARAGGKLARLGPYLGVGARAGLPQEPADAVEGIIVGSATLRDVRVDPTTRAVRVTVAFEANYAERRGGAEQSYYAHEEWTLERAVGARSRPPERARVVGCASCGAPLDKIVGGTCRHCNATAGAAVDWRLMEVVASREPRGPILTGTTEEKGTEDPTLVAPDAKERWAELCARDPAVTWSSFCARVALVFETFHRTWAAQDLTAVRPLLSDLLFETQRYWVTAYEAQGLRNVTDDPVIVTTQLSKVARDAYFDAVTVRVFATCKDYTLDREGKVVAGSRHDERRYTEYWTFIRSATRAGAPRADAACPSCGAPLADIGMAGKCASCGVKITSGDFDWILSRIEQDEVYALS